MKLSFWSIIKQTLATTVKNKVLIRSLMGILLYSVLLLVLCGNDLPTAQKFEVGKPAPWDVKAATNVQVTDNEQTLKAQKAASDAVAVVETLNPYATSFSEEKIDKTFKVVHKLSRLHKREQADTKENSELFQEQYNKLIAELPFPISSQTLTTLAATPPPMLDQYQTSAKHLLSIVMNEGVREEQLSIAYDKIKQAANTLPVDDSHRSMAIEIACKCVVPNLFPDLSATRQAQAQAIEKVEPCLKVILPGQIVIREGDIVAEQDLPTLEALGIYKPTITTSGLISYSLFILALLSVISVYIYNFSPRILERTSSTLALTLLIIGYILTANFLTSFSIYLAPIAVPAMLLTTLFEAKLALVIVSMLSLFVGIETSSLAACATSWITGSVAIYCMSNVEKRWDIVTTSLTIAGTNIVSVLIFALLGHQETETIVRDTIFYGGLNGLTSSLLAAGASPFLERLFGVTTHIRLMEYCNPSEPLLHELLTRAPGTYQHSIMVANLAEAAAQTIGADSVLCRAGAYYHDVGKMKQPSMFVENQLGGLNPHDKLPAPLSAMIVISHVSLGMELARTYKLPAVISQFITEHHGTNLASFFFMKAQAKSDEPVFEEDFRYPGPKPQSKETAIIMICDGIEAASRTVNPPTKENLQKLIDKMVAGNIKNQQLDECDLSLKEINMVKASLLRTLSTHYHSRIAYPDANKSKAKKTAATSSATDVPTATTAAATAPVTANATAEEKKPETPLVSEPHK